MAQNDHTIIRGKLLGTDDSGKQQKVQVQGRAGEQLGSEKNGVPRHEGYPMNTHLPKGSLVVVMMQDGNPDQATILGGEHPDHRKTDLQEGEFEIGDIWGKSLKATENGWTLTVGPLTIIAETVVVQASGTVTMSSGGVFHINP